MPERNGIERLDEAIDAILGGRGGRPDLVSPETATLLVVATDLRGLPDPAFREALMSELVPEVRREKIQEVSPESHTMVPYFIVDDPAGFIEFLRDAFGAVERFRSPRPDGSIQHAEVAVGDSRIEMGGANEEFPPLRLPIHLYVDDADAAYTRAIDAGAKSLMAPADQFYGDREAAVEDRWGNQWYVATRREGNAKPEGFRSVTPGFRTHGAAKAMEFLTRAFGAEPFGEIARLEDGSVMHAVMRIGDSLLELGDPHEPWGPMQTMIHLYVPDADTAYARAIEAGAESLAPPADQPYGERSGGVMDPFGNTWWIGTVIAK
ncbi:MAG: VOC family protein [Thermoanaerobaculia bacterium]